MFRLRGRSANWMPSSAGMSSVRMVRTRQSTASSMCRKTSRAVFPSAFSTSRVTANLAVRSLQPRNALDMVRRRARDAGIAVPGLCNQSLRATGITSFIAAGGALETAQAIAGHASPRTTQIYDRTGNEIALDEIERIIL